MDGLDDFQLIIAYALGVLKSQASSEGKINHLRSFFEDLSRDIDSYRDGDANAWRDSVNSIPVIIITTDPK